MSRILLSVIVLTAGWCLIGLRPAPAQSSPGPKIRTDTVALDSTGYVDIDNPKGSITVTTWGRAKVGYRATLAPSEGDSALTTGVDIRHAADEMSFGREESWSLTIPGVLTISPNGTRESGTGVPIGHYRIVMPKTASLEIDGSASTIEVSGLRGRADLETISGSITAAFEKFKMASSAETVSGDLRFYFPSDTGFVLETDADSSQITIDEAFGLSRDDDRWIVNGGGPRLSVETVSGRIELRPLEAYPPSP